MGFYKVFWQTAIQFQPVFFCAGTSPYPGIHVGAGFYKLIQDGYRMNEPEFAPSEM